MPITLDGTLGLGTPALSLGGTAVTASAAALNSSGGDVNSENRVINGDMNIWQRGTSTSGVAFAADRWLNSGLGGGTTQSRQAFTLGDTLGVNSPTYFLRQTVSGQTLASHFSVTLQKIEGVRSYAGQTITVLGWARRSSGIVGNMACEGIQSFGTTLGSPTGISPGVFGISPTTVTLGATWAPFAIVITFPSIALKTLGTDGNDWSGFQFFTSAGADYNSRTNSLGLQTIGVDLWGIHIRTGTWTAADAALYRPRDPGTELALCQRFYEKSYDIATAPGTNTGVAGSIEDMSMPTSSPLRVRFAVSKRALPVMAVYDAVGTVNRVTAYLPAQTNGTVLGALDNIGNSGFKAFLVAAGLTRLSFHWTADAEIV